MSSEDNITWDSPGEQTPDENGVVWDSPQTDIFGPAKTAAAIAGTGLAAGLTGWGAGQIANMVAPGATSASSLRNAITNLDSAIKRSDSTMSLQKLFGEYMGDVVNSGKNLTFADWIGGHGDYNTLSETVKEALAHSGKEAPVIKKMKVRDMNSRERVLSDLSSTLGVPRQDLETTMEQLKSQKTANAEPLYAEAFKDKNPIRDTKLYDLFGTDTPNMSMMNALRDRLRSLGLSGKEAPTLLATETTPGGAPMRKDWWKRLSTTDVPDQLFTGKEPWNQLREYFAPGIEDLHGMRQHLWDNYVKAKKAGASTDANSYLDSWKKVTSYMDEFTSDAYKKARKQYAGDSSLENAAELGGNLLKEKPEELRKALLRMSPEERAALGQGFYGGVQNLYDTKGVRGIADLMKAEDSRNALSAIYTNPAKRDQFIEALNAEAVMRNSLREYTGRAVSHSPAGVLHRGAAALAGVTGHPMSMLYHGAHIGRGGPSAGVSRAVTDISFDEPRFAGKNAIYPPWYDQAARPAAGFWPRVGAGLRSMPKSRFGLATGALGALGAAAAMYAPGRRPVVQGEPEIMPDLGQLSVP